MKVALLSDIHSNYTPKTIAFYKSMGFREMSEIGCCGFVRIQNKLLKTERLTSAM